MTIDGADSNGSWHADGIYVVKDGRYTWSGSGEFRPFVLTRPPDPKTFVFTTALAPKHPSGKEDFVFHSSLHFGGDIDTVFQRNDGHDELGDLPFDNEITDILGADSLKLQMNPSDDSIEAGQLGPVVTEWGWPEPEDRLGLTLTWAKMDPRYAPTDRTKA